MDSWQAGLSRSRRTHMRLPLLRSGASLKFTPTSITTAPGLIQSPYQCVRGHFSLPRCRAEPERQSSRAIGSEGFEAFPWRGLSSRAMRIAMRPTAGEQNSGVRVLERGVCGAASHLHELRDPNSGDEHVCLPYFVRQVLGARVAARLNVAFCAGVNVART